MSIAKSGFDPAWLARGALLIVDMNRSHLDHSIGHLLVAKADADRIIARSIASNQFGVMSVKNNLKTDAEVKDALEKAF